MAFNVSARLGHGVPLAQRCLPEGPFHYILGLKIFPIHVQGRAGVGVYSCQWVSGLVAVFATCGFGVT